MRMRTVGVASVAAVAAAVLSASAPLPSSGRPAAHPPLHHSPQLVLVVPALFAFDDLAPTEAAALRRRPSAPPLTAVTTVRLTHPPRKGVDGSSPAAGTPQAVLAAAYRKAVSRAPRGCHLQPAHLAAIGQVESGSIGGRSVTADHRVSPAIYGPLLDGGPFAVVRDSDGGAYDGAGDYDRAVGPLQFLPGTWSWAGRDGDGDGRRDPQNVFDAAMATADYLCRDGRDLSRSGDLRAAVLSYNQSGAYHSAVLEWVSYFQRHGLAALTTVAFRVGSGGRASALAEPTPDPTPPATPATPAKSPKPTRTGPPATAGPPATDPGDTDGSTPTTTPTTDPSAPPATTGGTSPEPTTPTTPAAPTPSTTPSTPTPASPDPQPT